MTLVGVLVTAVNYPRESGREATCLAIGCDTLGDEAAGTASLAFWERMRLPRRLFSWIDGRSIPNQLAIAGGRVAAHEASQNATTPAPPSPTVARSC